jgi:hypothetical protein
MIEFIHSDGFQTIFHLTAAVCMWVTIWAIALEIKRIRKELNDER